MDVRVDNVCLMFALLSFWVDLFYSSKCERKLYMFISLFTFIWFIIFCTLQIHIAAFETGKSRPVWWYSCWNNLFLHRKKGSSQLNSGYCMGLISVKVWWCVYEYRCWYAFFVWTYDGHFKGLTYLGKWSILISMWKTILGLCYNTMDNSLTC